jgi:hypothetical protein
MSVKIKNMLTIPMHIAQPSIYFHLHIRDRVGEVVKEGSTESEVKVGNSTYMLKNRYFEEHKGSIRRIL